MSGAYPLKLFPILWIAAARLVREGHVRIAGLVAGVCAVLEVLEDHVEVRQPGSRQHPDVVDQPRHAPGRERAAREAHEEDLVAGDVVLRDEIVPGADVGRDALRGGAANRARQGAALRSDAGFVVGHLRDAVGAFDLQRAEDAGDVAGDGELALVEAVVGIEPRPFVKSTSGAFPNLCRGPGHGNGIM